MRTKSVERLSIWLIVFIYVLVACLAPLMWPVWVVWLVVLGYGLLVFVSAAEAYRG
jgi:hypothetical protein